VTVKGLDVWVRKLQKVSVTELTEQWPFQSLLVDKDVNGPSLSKCKYHNITLDFDLMKGNPTLHLRKSDSSNSQAMASSSCKKIKKTKR